MQPGGGAGIDTVLVLDGKRIENPEFYVMLRGLLAGFSDGEINSPLQTRGIRRKAGWRGKLAATRQESA